MKKLTIGILAHVDSGKTTLSEALLFESGIIRTLGRVDHKNTFLDNFELERKRGITIFSKQALFTTDNFEITLLDAAILIVSAASGVQSHTETLWSLLRKHNIPTFVFVNKMDVPNADKSTLISEFTKSSHAM